MARKRMIDPSIWSDEKLGLLTPLHRLLFIGLFSNADDEGRLPGHPNYIKSLIFPYDNDITPQNVETMLNDLNSKGLILTYMVNGQRYIQVVNFLKYQKINRPTPSKIPPPPVETTVKNATTCFSESSLNTHGVVIEHSLNTHGIINEDSVNTHEQFTAQIEIEKEEEKERENKNKSVIANAITPRTGSDEPTCVAEKHRTSTTTQEKKLGDEQGMAVTSEPGQVTDTEVQPETNNNALITTGDEELEQLLEEFFEDGGETAENQETAKIKGLPMPTGESEKEKPSVPVEVPEDQETAESRERLITTGVELEDSEECNMLQQDQDTAITQDHLIADEKEEIEQLLEEFFAGVPDQAGAPPSTMPADILPAGDTGTTEVHDSVGDVPSERVQTGYDNFSPPGSQQEINTDGTHTVSNSGVATAVASRDAPACVPVNTSKTEDYQEEPVEKAPEVTNQDLIGILTHKFHEITKPLKHRSDYSYIGGLYNKFNYFIVDSALDRLKRKVERDGPMDSMKSYRAYLTRVCMNINQECVDPAGAQKQRKQYSKARTLKVSTEEIKKQIETQTTLF